MTWWKTINKLVKLFSQGRYNIGGADANAPLGHAETHCVGAHQAGDQTVQCGLAYEFAQELEMDVPSTFEEKQGGMGETYVGSKGGESRKDYTFISSSLQ
jgi:hypothetical protein